MFEINNTDSMDKFKTEYDRIIETLKSCKIQSHLDTTEKYYKLFRQKWAEFYNSEDRRLDELTYNCDKKFEIMLSNKRKTLGWI